MLAQLRQRYPGLRQVRPGELAQPGFPWNSISMAVGYADTMHTGGGVPSPWAGSPGVIFKGCTGSCSFDGGAIMGTNHSGQTLTLNTATVQLNANGDTTPCIVPTPIINQAVPPGGTVVGTQVASGAGSGGCPTNELFNGSDSGPNGSDWAEHCTQSGVVPLISVTVNNTAAVFTDSQQILNSGGIDKGGCTPYTNEFHPFTALGTGQVPSNIFGPFNPVIPGFPACNWGSYPVNCATGNFWHSFNLLSVPGRGVPLDLGLTYNSLAAAQPSPFGFGWSFSYGANLQVSTSAGTATVTQEDGATVQFSLVSGAWQAPSWVPATLTQNSDGTYTFVRRHGDESLKFSAGGQLLSITDRNGYVTSLGYNGSGQLASISDPEGRSLTLGYGPNGDVSQISDSAGRQVGFGYDPATGDLTSISRSTNDGTSLVTQLGYDGSHELTTLTDPRNDGSLVNKYDSQGRVIQQTDPMNRLTKFSYVGDTTTITDPKGNVTEEQFADDEPITITRGVGTSSQATWRYQYDPVTLALSQKTDPNLNTTTYTSDADGNITGTKDALGNTTSATYNSFDEPLQVTDQNNNKTTYGYDGAGNLQSVSRTLIIPGQPSQTQQTVYTYGDPSHPGDVTAIEDPNLNTWNLTYDAYGDLASSTDPKGDETTYGYSCSGTPAQGCYSNIGFLYSSVSPRGNVTGANPAQFTSSYTYNGFGEPLTATDALGHTTIYQYDGNGNRTFVQDADGNQTTYEYDPDNELDQVDRPGTTPIKTGYDDDGNLHTQTDGAGQVTTYNYDPLNRLSQAIDPKTRMTSYGYDPAGNLHTVTDPLQRVTTYGYDADNRLKTIGYSDGTTPNVSFTYYPNGQRETMIDGTGTTSYFYDSLDRLTSQTNGAGQQVSYGYDLANNETQITYPNGKQVTRGYDAAERLHTITDWLGNTTTVDADPDSNVKTTTFPQATNNVDSYAYNNADQLTLIGMTQGSTTLATLSYTPDNLGQLSSETRTGLPGPSSTSYGYSQLNQLQSAGANGYAYDTADNLTTLDGNSGYAYDAANELTSSPASASPDQTSPVATNYSYDSLGERTSATPTGGLASTYSYDQAGRLTKTSPATYPTMLAAGYGHSLALQANGTVLAWGENTDGELGDGTTTTRSSAQEVHDLAGVTQIATSMWSNLAVKADGTVWAWGYGGRGQLGDGTTQNRSIPIQVQGLSGVASVAAPWYHSLAVDNSGRVWAWGDNAAGDLGNGTLNPSTTPVQVQGLSNAVAVAGGAESSMALKSDGTVWGWGSNSWGQLGTGPFQSTTPIQISGLSGVTAIASGELTDYALESNGTVWAWGWNNDGELGGAASPTGQPVPAQIPGLTNVKQIIANGEFAVAIKNDGTVWAWGNNSNGQLADGTTTDRFAPEQISGLNNPTAVAAGNAHTLALTTPTALLASGFNPYGQLGDGTTTERHQLTTAIAYQPPPAPPPTATYTYDGDGQRATKTSNSTTSSYAWDETGRLPLLLTDTQTNYIYGPGNLPIEQIASNGTVTYLHHDQLGSTRLITNSTGNPVATFTYNPYGALQASTGNATTPIGYAGQYTDPQTGLQYNQARYYDPTTGQFLTRDPLDAVTRQAYAYAAGNPVNLTDPSGQEIPFVVAVGCADPFTAVICAGAAAYGAYTAASDLSGGGGDNGNSGGGAADTSSNASETTPGCDPESSATEGGSAFDLAQFPRGLSIEADLGGNLPRSFPTIDRFENGIATSIKSVDLSAPSYSSGNALANRLTGYINNVASFQGARFGGVDIAAGDITGRGLDIAVQQGVATPAQTAALDQAVAYGATRGVDVQVVEVP